MATTGNSIQGLIQGQIDAMSPRDRKLLTGLVMFMSFVAVGILWYGLASALENQAGKVRDLKGRLTEALELQQRHAVAAEEIRLTETQLLEYKNQRLSPFLEKLAKAHNIQDKLSKVDELSTTTVGNINQTTFKVELKKVEMATLWRFLHDMETNGYPLKVENANFNVVYIKRVKHLDLSMEVVVYTIEEGA